MCEAYERLMKNSVWKAILEMLDEMYRSAEKAHPALPDSIKDIICSGVGKATEYKDWDMHDSEPPGVFMLWYYLPIEKCYEILQKYKKKYRGFRARQLSWAYFFYSPTSSREGFEKWKEELSRFKTLEEILAEYTVTG